MKNKTRAWTAHEVYLVKSLVEWLKKNSVTEAQRKMLAECLGVM
ncbi:hypothetical protein ACP3V3_10290 [Vibrio sp. PNB22_3_1]